MSSKSVLWVLSGLVVLVWVSAALAGEPPGAGLSLEVDVTPVAEPPGAFEARVVVTDLATEEVLAAPRVLFLRGDEARMRSGSTAGFEVDVVVRVDEAAETATCEAVLTQGETVVGRQRVSVRLAGSTAS